MNYNFNLRPLAKGQSKKEPRLIYFVSYFTKEGKKEKFTYSTKLKVLENHWDGKKQRVKNVLEATNSQIINNFLNELSTNVTNWRVKCIAESEIITPKTLKTFLDNATNKTEKPETLTFFTFFKQFIDNAPSRINHQTNKIISERTVKKYRSTLVHLEKYAATQKRKILDFEDINIDFYNGFLSYLTTVKDMKTNTIGKYISIVKVVLGEAERTGLTVPQAYKSRYFKVLREDVGKTYLSENELKTLELLDLSDNERLDRVRDFFLIGAWTGLRFSDFTDITPERIIKGDNGQYDIKLFQHKTEELVVIPCHSVVLDILKKYDFKLPKAISNQKFNDYLKELCQLVGFTQRIELKSTKGGKRQTDISEKWERISSHTARRSFATNFYKRKDVKVKTIMAMTGHKTEKAFYSYIVLDNDEHAEIFRESLK
jgi:integrase